MLWNHVGERNIIGDILAFRNVIGKMLFWSNKFILAAVPKVAIGEDRRHSKSYSILIHDLVGSLSITGPLAQKRLSFDWLVRLEGHRMNILWTWTLTLADRMSLWKQSGVLETARIAEDSRWPRKCSPRRYPAVTLLFRLEFQWFLMALSVLRAITLVTRW